MVYRVRRRCFLEVLILPAADVSSSGKRLGTYRGPTEKLENFVACRQDATIFSFTHIEASKLWEGAPEKNYDRSV